MSEQYVLGIDVGSAEVRCGLVRRDGCLVKMATCPVGISSPAPGYYQQSSKKIWRAVVQTIKEVINRIDVDLVKGIGCDATCSLVVVGPWGETVSVSPQGDSDEDVIMWLDHRAGEEAEMVNDTGHDLLDFLGGKVSLEMQVPKLLWLRRHLPQSFDRAQHFFDLPDFLTWKLTGSLIRSQCSLVCKWMYEGSPQAANPGWDASFLSSVGLYQLCQNNFAKIGEKVSMPGEVVGFLKDDVARELGLKTGTPVATSLIDAHAGTLGLLATKLPGLSPCRASLTARLGMICGTSSCLMLLSDRGASVGGVWGPYYGAVLDGTWLSEGGQSCAGQLIDHLVKTHPFKLNCSGPDEVCRVLTQTLLRMAEARGRQLQSLTESLHLYPDFRGNRSPLADPNLRGMVSGLDLDSDQEQLALIYLASLQALSYSARQTVEKLESKNLGPVECVVLCGGLSKNGLFVSTLAGALDRPVLLPNTQESVLLGSAMLAATASGLYGSLRESMQAMASSGRLVAEGIQSVLRFHQKKYRVFLKMQEDQIAYRDIMSSE